MPLGANDLDLTRGSLQFPFRDMQEISSISATGPGTGPNTSQDTGAEIGVTPVEPLAQAPTERGWAAAIIVSCLAHAAVAAVFLITPAGTSDFQDATQSEGSDQSGANVVGSALDREAPAMKVTLVPNPQPTKPAAAKAEKPVPPTKPSQPTTEATKQPLEPLPEAVKQSAAMPDILVSGAADDQSVVPKTPAQPTVQTESTEAPAAFAGQPPIPSARPSPPSRASEADEKRGTADGQDRSAQAASKGKKQNEAGIAAESSYRSDVIRKLSRVNRGVPPSVQATARNNAVVTFVIGNRGGINELRILQSSGSSDFDQVVLGIVRKAAPFPPIPTKVGNNLVFTGEIGPF
ncbi:TonB family protein [Mesorhizobium sp. AA22]|uniref:TonB family protein n=1 Tax=Mesorhizobium sp. AA22 TaxID=1854057 RepID=UPI001FEF8B66|nr:TonB family protein [Mesorhizobium sp. AA22]